MGAVVGGKVLVVMGGLVLMSLIALPVQAQELALSLNPPLVEAAIKPGKSIVIAYTIANGGDPLIVSAQLSRFRPAGLDGGIILENTTDGPIRFNLENSDIKLGKAFFVRNDKGQQLLLKIRVPEGTPQGDYYYTFYVQNELGRKPEGIPAALAQARIGSNILLSVTQTGDIDVKGSIGDFNVRPRFLLRLFGRSYPIFESTDIIPIDLIVQNTGQSLIKPIGSVQLRGTFGEEAEYSVVSQNILAQSSRRVHASPSAQLNPGDRGSHAGLRDDASLYIKGFFVGKYTIATDVNFGDAKAGDKATTVFYAIPYKLISAFGVVVILSIIVLKKYRQV